MTPDQYERVGELFARLGELAPAERSAEIDRVCAGDIELRRQVVRLLEADQEVEAGAFLERRAMDDAARLLEQDSTHLPELGAVIGNYRLDSRIGAGGMGVVYEGQDLRLPRRVAIKVLPLAPDGEDPELVQRFHREARAASLLSHPNIVSIFDADVDRGYSYIAMELVEGRTLRQLLESNPRGLDQRTILDLICQTAAALSAAHEAGVVHRDVKPENIMVRPDGFVKVLDFGLAKVENPNLESMLKSRAGLVAGTLHYLSPEQILGKPATPRSDLFSLGAVLYELATGALPFRGDTDGAIFDAVLHAVPEHPCALRPVLNRDLAAAILRALEKDPDLRFQTARDFRSAMLQIGRGSFSAIAVPLPRPTPPRHWSPAMLAAVLAVAGGAVGWLFLTRPRPLRQPVEFVQLTARAAADASPSLTPDGRQFIYASQERGNWDIYLQRTGGVNAVNLTANSPADDTQPALSRDGARIAFRSEREGGGLYVTELTGENPRRVASSGYLPAWSPDGRSMAYSTVDFTVPSIRGAPVSRLVVTDITSGEQRQLPTAGDGIQPNWSPHGARIAYWGIDSNAQRDIYTIAATDPDQRPVAATNDAALDWNPVWSSSGDAIYFLSDRGGTMNVWRVPVDESTGQTLGPAEPMTSPSLNVLHLNTAPDGSGFIYTAADNRTMLFRIGFDAARQMVSGPAEAMWGNDETLIFNFSFSPDGRQLVYDNVGDRQEDLWISSLDGAQRRRLTSDQHLDRIPTWSPVRNEIAFLSGRSGALETWVIRSDGGGLRQLTNVGQRRRAIWSPDGRWILAGAVKGLPVLVDSTAPGSAKSPPAPGLAGKEGAIFWDWKQGADVAVGEHHAGETAEIVFYRPFKGEYEATGMLGRRPVWLPGGRQIIFVRGAECVLYDPSAKKERRLFTVAPNELYAVNPSQPGRIYFTQTVLRSQIWMGRWEPGR
ncbi:MAG: protein kinase [Bryobacteraceae bacterium]